MNKYQIQSSNKFKSFKLCLASDQHLCVFGNDVTIFKEDLNTKSFCNERNNYFNYGWEKNCLFGQIGQFGIKRIRVIQMN